MAALVIQLAWRKYLHNKQRRLLARATIKKVPMVSMIRAQQGERVLAIYGPPGLFITISYQLILMKSQGGGMKQAFPPSRAEIRATIKVFNPQPKRTPRPNPTGPVYASPVNMSMHSAMTTFGRFKPEVRL